MLSFRRRVCVLTRRSRTPAAPAAVLAVRVVFFGSTVVQPTLRLSLAGTRTGGFESPLSAEGTPRSVPSATLALLMDLDFSLVATLSASALCARGGVCRFSWSALGTPRRSSYRGC